jgi:hypothetical protein
LSSLFTTVKLQKVMFASLVISNKGTVYDSCWCVFN